MTHGSSQDMTITRPSEVRLDALLAKAIAILRECEQKWGCECPYCDRDFGKDFDSHADDCSLKRFLDAANANQRTGTHGQPVERSATSRLIEPEPRPSLDTLDSLVRLVCTECGWRGTDDDVLEGDHPFRRGEWVYGCPSCREIECLRGCCDEPGCWEPDTCGTPTPNGYRRTCGKHKPNVEHEPRALASRGGCSCSPSPWRRMTPEEYARDFASFPPHRAEVTMAVKGEPASAEVSVFIVSTNAGTQVSARSGDNLDVIVRQGG